MSTASVGRAREWKVRDHLIGQGWELVCRASASKGPADLVMVHDTYGLAFIQVGSKSKALGPADRERLLRVSDLAVALPLYAIVIPRQPIRFHVATRDTASTWATWPEEKCEPCRRGHCRDCLTPDNCHGLNPPCGPKGDQ